MNILIIGSGISGLACGNLMKEKGWNIKILERKAIIGGLVHCDRVDDFCIIVLEATYLIREIKLCSTGFGASFLVTQNSPELTEMPKYT